MNQHTRVEFLTALNEQADRFGVAPAYVSSDECPAVVVDALYESNAPYLFENCDNLRARLFLECFLASFPNCEWNLNCQLAKLAATRGALVKDYGCVVKANGGINLLEAVVESVGMIGESFRRVWVCVKAKHEFYGVYCCKENDKPGEQHRFDGDVVW